ncbi:hypothetical protein GCM10011390_48380 [Aureimonas endophytica]|uniref:Uncharacterized protein n=1 Tax=Aureimonas endophytica TaxID=2027858 RepID=A0A917A2M0_9HYPH|nr:hypothetical protein GCM10011390_48380 [Aureimonas endophytica]
MHIEAAVRIIAPARDMFRADLYCHAAEADRARDFDMGDVAPSNRRHDYLSIKAMVRLPNRSPWHFEDTEFCILS